MGGSSGGGGGGSGAVSWPDYLQQVHYGVLTLTGADGPSKSIVASLNDAIILNPIDLLVAFDPSTDVAAMENALATFAATVSAYVPDTKWEDNFDTASAKIGEVISETTIGTASAALSDSLQDELDDEILPRYRLGMRDLNMINSSAYALGEALIQGKKLKEISKFESDLRIKGELAKFDGVMKSVDRLSTDTLTKLQYQQALASLTLETSRLAIVASKEYTDKQLELEIMEARWDLECYQYVANMIASVSGGTSTAAQRGSPLQSAIGGALSGAAMGGMIAGASGGAIGGPMGMLVGAGIGLGASFL